ncbi:MAG: type III-A CRISPR-associated RAMP protein Csm3 [Oscillospiraceae bacterium]|nr:type III-A CRISPR-associated RAMP protein Csm3 [Oscillospiraceae bacterium]
MKLKKLISFDGTVDCVTGIAIKGAGNDLGIGGADSEVIKNPLTNEPYLPGSSLKGKMRSQLERKYGAKKAGRRDQPPFPTEEEPCGCGETGCPICTIFGAHLNTKAKSAPTRIIVRDCPMTDAFREQIRNLPLERGSYLEIKGENIIDRRQGLAKSPRFMERVPAGASFELHIKLQIFEGDDETRLRNIVEEGLRMVEDSCLGGSGSRGYGQVKFTYEVTEKEV